jgi:glycerophosphoryl diester phosphodiesterase
MSLFTYPARVIAHRGGGVIAPENTVAGLREAHARGYVAVEFDVMLARDGAPVLMHDDDLDRTTSGRGPVPGLDAGELSRLDAGSWRDARFAGEPVPGLAAAAQACIGFDLFANVEIKPWGPGGAEVARRTGEVVAAATAAAWHGREARVLMSSFSREALEAAQAATPRLPRAFLYDDVPADWPSTLAALDCVALHCNARKLDADTARAIKEAGFALMCWTVNDPALAERLFGWGVDAICTDCLDLFAAMAGQGPA